MILLKEEVVYAILVLLVPLLKFILYLETRGFLVLHHWFISMDLQTRCNMHRNQCKKWALCPITTEVYLWCRPVHALNSVRQILQIFSGLTLIFVCLYTAGEKFPNYRSGII